MSECSNPIIIEFIQALQDEIKALEKTENPYTTVWFRQQLAHTDNQYWYLFEAKYPVAIAKDSPCLLEFDDKGYSVHVLESEGKLITLSSYTELPKVIGSARLVRGSIALVKRLVQCLNENGDQQNPVGARMFSTNDGIYAPQKIANFDISILPKENTARQNQAIYSALTNDISYLWGLPGSGKTTIIGQIIHHLYLQKRSVLVVSHTNTAIDGALEKAFKYINEDNLQERMPCPILRIGTPARKLPSCILLEDQARALNQDLSTKYNQLCDQRNCIEQRQIFLEPYLPKCKWISLSRMAELQDLRSNIASLQEKTCNLEEQRVSLLERFADASRKYAQLTDCRTLDIALQEEQKRLGLILESKIHNRKCKTSKYVSVYMDVEDFEKG